MKNTNNCFPVEYWFLFKKFSALQHLLNFGLHMARPHRPWYPLGIYLCIYYHNNNTALPIIAAFIYCWSLRRRFLKIYLNFHLLCPFTELSHLEGGIGRGFSFTFYKFQLVLTMIYICTLPTWAVCLSSSIGGDYNVKKLMTTDDRLIDT